MNLVPTTRTWDGYDYCHPSQLNARGTHACCWCEDTIPIGHRFVRTLYSVYGSRGVREHCVRCWVLLCAVNGWPDRPRGRQYGLFGPVTSLVGAAITLGRDAAQAQLLFEVEYDPRQGLEVTFRMLEAQQSARRMLAVLPGEGARGEHV